MAWQNVPIGMIRHDELLNALLAIWKTQHNIVNRHLSEFSQGYETGFEEGLDAIAQIAGLTEEFEAAKAIHRAKVKAKLHLNIELIDSQATFLEE